MRGACFCSSSGIWAHTCKKTWIVFFMQLLWGFFFVHLGSSELADRQRLLLRASMRGVRQSYNALSYSTWFSCFFHVDHSTAVIMGIKKSAVLRASNLYDCVGKRYDARPD